MAPAPDILVVNDGSPVESVGKQTKTGSLGRVAAFVLLPLIAGVVIGKVAENANQHNQVLADAKPLAEDVKVVRRGLTELQAVLEGAKKGDKFAPGDEKLTEALKALPKIEADEELIYKSALYHLDVQEVAAIYGFYADIRALKRDLQEHIAESQKDAKILKEGAVKLGSFNPGGYGALLSVPSADDGAAGKPVTFKMVQLGPPICEGDTRPNPQGCDGPPTGFAYRTDETGNWQTGKVAAATGDPVPGDALVYLDPGTATIKQLVTGGGVSLAEIAYTDRIEHLEQETQRLLEEGKNVEKFLNAKANESEKFSFFL